MSDRDRLIEAATQEIVAGGWPRAQATVILDALTASPELAGVLARYAAEKAGRRITHGRHCACTPCADEDWTNPALAPCGMHGSSCPAVYAPLGAAGEAVPDA